MPVTILEYPNIFWSPTSFALRIWIIMTRKTVDTADGKIFVKNGIAPFDYSAVII